MDKLIEKYAKELERIYENRMAGDYTFSGVLVDFLSDILSSCEKTAQLRDRHNQYSHNIPPCQGS